MVAIDYCLSVSSDCSLAISLTVSFVSSFPFLSLAVSGLAYVSCHFTVPGSCIVYFSCCFASSLDAIKGLLLRTSCAVSRILVMQMCDLLLPTLLNDGVYFALILEEFLGNVLHDGVEKRERQRCGRSCRQKQNVEDNEFTELNALVGSVA